MDNEVSLAGEQTHRAGRRGTDRHLKQESLAPATVAHQAKASYWNTLRKEDRFPIYITKEFGRAVMALQEFWCRKHAIKKNVRETHTVCHCRMSLLRGLKVSGKRMSFKLLKEQEANGWPGASAAFGHILCMYIHVLGLWTHRVHTLCLIWK